MQLYVYSALSAAARALLLQRLPTDIQPVFASDLAPDQQLPAFQQAAVLLGNVPPAWLTEHQPAGLRFWQIDSAGFDQYAGLRVPFPVANMGDYFAWPCAETIVAGILSFYRRIPELAVLQQRREWVGPPVRTRVGLLRGKRVIILGAGGIGLAVREQLAGFRCQVRLLARTNPEAQLHSAAELAADLPTTDLVINCLPGSADGFFSAELVAAMAPGSLYASVGRGNTTDEPALLAALQAGKISAVLDVTAQEPLPADSPLWTLPNVLLTQHSGGGQPHEDEGKVELLLRNLGHLRHGQPLENLVEPGRGY
ncbi:D-2-hydroxyacid dehydrogenase [Hymenobacter aquaticus]|uniref:D-2-hydroxyacid dehydrogenase n=1 Tax=Hymenobacter aquaticus TaxID=1867101 RepID=A0A4Z0Q811_9BACT|nr:D-2-hydroxyacid dehydrogenase [Hymenobacter aquaticus]TGE25566.1 D-2-hydroxyacid dehydrogenase [Hymenobacter aquaticus]